MIATWFDDSALPWLLIVKFCPCFSAKCQASKAAKTGQNEQVCLFLALTHIYTIVQTNQRVHNSPLACAYIARRTSQDNGVAGFHRAIARYGSMGRKKPFIIILWSLHVLMILPLAIDRKILSLLLCKMPSVQSGKNRTNARKRIIMERVRPTFWVYWPTQSGICQRKNE